MKDTITTQEIEDYLNFRRYLDAVALGFRVRLSKGAALELTEGLSLTCEPITDEQLEAIQREAQTETYRDGLSSTVITAKGGRNGLDRDHINLGHHGLRILIAALRAWDRDQGAHTPVVS